MNKYREIIDNFIHWGVKNEKVRAALLIGSQARKDNVADEYSDLDIVMFVDEPELFLLSDLWLGDIGKYHVSFIESTIGGAKEKRVIFNDILDVDIIIQSYNTIDVIGVTEIADILLRGYTIIIDKVGLRKKLGLQKIIKPTYNFPSKQDFINTVNDFWYHCVWTAKKLKRGELWTAINCLDSYMKWKLLSIIEIHAKSKHGAEYDTWYGGRFLEEWADARIIDELSNCFAQYNVESIKNALLASMSLFRSLAIEISIKQGYRYPVSVDEYTFECVASLLDVKKD